MDSHKRYTHFPTTDLSILESFDTAFKVEPFTLLHKLIKNYSKQITNDNLDIKKLETVRTILCYEYQLLYGSKKKYTRTVSNDLCFKQIENVLNLKEQLQNSSDLLILYDIVILYTSLFCNLQCLEQHLRDFQKSHFNFLLGNENRVFYMKILECFLDSVQLRQLLNVNTRTQLLQLELELHIIPNITVWLVQDNTEWPSFASIFPKLMNTFDPEKVFPMILLFILFNVNDVQDQLSALSIIVDTCFSEKLKDTSFIYHKLCDSTELWLLIIKSLKSSVQQYRKQGLFLMKRLTDVSSTLDNSGLKSRKSTLPFMCTQSIKTEISIHDIKQKFYVVLEALEEKQYHLIAPALTHVPNLIKGSEEHTLCNDCFSTVWLQVIFERIFKHENNATIKQGISYVCQFHEVLRDSEFFKLFVNVLNNTFLYECQLYQKEPEIVDEIATLFVLIRNTEDEFISRLLKVIDEETWAPIPLFYMMMILRIVTERTLNVLKENDLIVMRFFIQKNLHAHSCIFRVASQIEIIRTISLSLERVDNLKIVANMLLEFPSDEALVRGSFSWNSITTCLRAKVTEIETLNFIKMLCGDYSHQDRHTNHHILNPAKIASIIFIFYDAGLILHTKSCSTEQILYEWFSLLNSCDIRPYANVEHILYTIRVMSELLNLSRNEDEKIIQLLSGHTRNALKFLLKNSKSIPSKSINYVEVNKYIITIISFFNHGNLILPKSEFLDYVEKFKYDSIIILKNIEQFTYKHYMYALHILHYTQSILDSKPTDFYVQPLLNMCRAPIFHNNEYSMNSKGKIASQCYLLLAKLTNQFLSNVETKLWPENIDWLENVSHIYEKGGTEIIPEVALTLKIIVDKRGINMNYSESMSSLESIFTICWKSTLLSSKNKLYFLAIKALLEVIVNSNFLILPNAVNLVNHFLEELLEESNKVPKLKAILLNEMKLLDTCSLRNLQQPLILCLLHGHALQRDKLIENQTYLYIAKNFETFYPQHISAIDHNNDGSIRALSVILLHRTITVDVEYATGFLPIVLQKLEEYKNKRYFNHSYIHKIKHRIMQILLVLQPILNEVDTTILVDLLCNLMLLESNQHSVRVMQEWLLIKIFTEYKNLHYKLWTFFEEGITKRPGCVSSIACIFYHVAKLLSEVDQLTFISMGMPYIARCCLGQQYNMRLYNQVIFMQLFQTLENLNYYNLTNEYRGLYKAIMESLKDENTMESFTRIKDDFYLSTFHALNDYSLQTIYFELPRLTDMDQSEWISPVVFEQLNFKGSQNHPLQMENLKELLSKVETSIYITKSAGADSGTLKKSYGINLGELSNIQKKIDPSSVPANSSHDYISSTIRESISKKKILPDEEGIIVVACLIDRTPNLGGLARTCEIFNVKELVIANLSQIRDKEFQNLSVSAENWITITEVKPNDLSKYLLEKRDMGWSLIGVEQTVNSITLLNMKFKKKSILVLGNEKDGIPANLIPLFDTCIEIPQYGVIRSLNVHVCGAICIWQYAMQHTF
ncbi:tRNA (guanosine(18)-2'-O)-methyltransferase TARBP1 [Halictus rubicundus]|uniref:tRNA (guanosine(18)-2'-O)-methyltransferase TARBP1 n=1 Tax=Halictus rubicundus TaxID=77578 RepID=UPI0040361567